jgi:ligand-binding SRPBCC domain-containing protein
MPSFRASQTLPRPIVEVFDFFAQPANLLRISPPDLNMKLLEGPARVQLGSRLVFTGRRWGVSQKIVSEVTSFELNVLFADEQREGPFKKWHHWHRFESVSGGTLIRDEIEFEPPGGLMGMMMNAQAIERDLKGIYEYRSQKLREILGDLRA